MVSGDWDNSALWTLDPSGMLYDNPGNYTPTTSPTSASDDVVILSGRTITVTSNTKSNDILTVTGNLDFGTSTGHSFNEIRGSGKIKLAADNFPAGTATHFISENQGEGTVVYYGTGYNLSTARTFYHVEVDMDNAADILVLMNDYTINGDLTISNGVFQINNTTAATRNLIILGTTLVESGTSFTVGTGNAVHNIDFQGDVTNNGSIDFANDAQYACAATGAVKVTFSGASDNTLTCNGTTDFYRLFLDKGTDETYIVDVVSTNTANFRLFGPVAGGGCLDAGAEGWENLALVLQNGTLKLGSNIDIPILGANRSGTASPNEFHIPSGTRLWIDGADVSTHTTGGGWRGITIYGTLQVTSGSFTNPDNTGGITYFSNVAEPGKLVLEGGTVTTTQVKEASTTGRFSYIQSGGTLYINNLSDSRASSAVFALPQADYVFNMSGGLIQIDAVNTTATNGIDIGCDDGNINVTGGTIELLIPTEDAGGEPEFEINSTAPFWNLTLTESANGGTQEVALQSDLTVLNDLSIGANTELETKGYDLSIGGDLIIEDGGVFDHDNNTTYFIGDQNSIIDIENNSTANVLQFYNLVIEKDPNGSNYYDVSIAECTGRTTTPSQPLNSIIQVQNDLSIVEGQFTIERYTVNLLGDLSLTDGNIVYNPSLSGRLRMNGTAAQSITGSVLYDPGLGYIELDNTNGATITTDVSMDFFTLTTGILNIGINRLSIDTNFVDGSGFGATKMIETTADHGAKGLKLKMDDDYTGGATVTFPVGSNGNWAKCDVNISSSVGSITGYLNITPVNQYHPTRAVGGCDAIDGYWKVKPTGLGSTSSGVEYQFYVPYADPGSGNEWEYMLQDGTWTSDNSFNSYPGTMTFEDADLDGFAQADFTLGKNACFNNVNTIYSATTGDWDVGSTWVGGAVPADYDYAVIRDGHTVSVTRNNQDDAGKVTVESGGTLDVGTYTGLTYNIVQGGGTIRIASNTVPTADYDDFMYNDTATFEYYGGAYTLPTDFSVYPNLSITGTGDKDMPNQDLLIRKNLYIDNITVTLNNNEDYVINDSIIVTNAGVLEFPNATGNCIVTVYKSIDLSRGGAANAIEIEVGGAYSNAHELVVYGDILTNTSSTMTLYRNGGDKAVDLYFEGDGNSTVYSDGATSNNIDLNRLIINKSDNTADVNFNEEFTLNAATNGTSAQKALYLVSGDLTIDNSLTDIDLTTGGGDFNIPAEASLNVLNATVNASGSSTGIYLDGLMTVGDGSSWLINGGTDNYIEYSVSGNARIEIEQGTLRVGSQIRRSTLTTEGILLFSQNHSNSTVIIGETGAPENNRGVFEILNAGSDFTQVDNAEITIVRQQTTPTIAALYLDPATSSLGSGAGFNLGNASTPAGQQIGIYSTIALQNLTIDNSSTNDPTALMWTVPLTINEDLTIETGATFDANGLNLIINGDFINSGTFTPNGNTTYFSGSTAQTITGNTSFYNLTKTSTTNLSLTAASTDITVTNNLDVQSGTLTDNSNDVYVNGNCNFDGTHVFGGSGDGISFNGSAEQQLTGNGTFGKLTIDNANGVVVPLGNNFTITNVINLQSGVFDIGKNLLSLGLNCATDGAPFSSSNMIQTNVSFTDGGIKKILPAGASTFTYPLGSGGKYTPVSTSITANGNSTGSITVKAADEMHPSIVEDNEAPDPEIVDADNVLQYHWVLRSSGISGFSATINMKYDPGDVMVTAPYDVYDYITARLLNDGSGQWNKYDDVDKFDETNELAIFDFTTVNDAGISGDYTAGVDGSTFNGAIPDSVPTYETNNTGNWSTGTIWTPNVAGGPRGAITLVNSGHSVTATANGILNYTTEVNGSVLLNSTFAHRFGEVTGYGLIYTEIGFIPAGTYTEFFSSAGGTLEYGGSTDHDVLGGYYEVNNVKFSGTGERWLPNGDLLLNGDFEIDGGATLTVVNDNNKDIEIRGDLIRTSGNFDAGSDLSNTISFTSSVTQTINGDFTGTNNLNTLEIDNANGVTLAGDVDIAEELILTNGIINSGSNALTIALNATVSPVAGTSTRHVDGPLTKVMNSSNDFTYPIGDNGNLGVIELIDVNGWGGGSGNFSGEYFFSNPTTDIGSAMESGINTVSNSEYWEIQAPSGGQGLMEITLDGSSDVANALSDINDLVILGWDGSEWDAVGGNYTISGSATSGSIVCDTDIDFDSYSYFTLGSAQTITLITASIISGDVEICAGEDATITIALTGGTTPWQVQYTDGTSTFTETGINSSPHDITVSPSATTTYTLTTVQDNVPLAGSIVGDADAIVTVNALPSITFTNNSTADEICNGDEVIFTATGGSNYDFHLNGTSDQDGSLATYTTSTLADQDDIYVVVTNSNGCSDTSSTTTIDVYLAPTASAGSDEAICAGDTLDLSTSTTPPSAANYAGLLWTSSGTGGFDNSTVLQPEYVPSAADESAGSVTLTLTANGNASCAAANDNMSLIIDPIPSITLGVNPTVCAGTTTADLPYSATSGTPDLYSIDFDVAAEAAGFADVLNGALPATPIVITVPGAAPAAVYNGTLTVVNSAANCPSTNYAITVTVNAVPVPTISGTDSTCVGTELTYTTEAGADAGTYVWTIPPAFGTITAGGGVNDNTVTVDWNNFTPLGSPTTISVTYQLSGCSPASATELDVMIFKLPETGPSYYIDNSYAQ